MVSRHYPDLCPEHIQVRSADNIFLDGRFFHGDRPSLIILASGYGDTQDQMLPIAKFLHDAGFGDLTFNSRARIPSGGKYVTLGVLEQQDLITLVSYVTGRKDVDANRIGVLGISMGGATAILGVAKDKRIGAVVDDSGFSDAPRVTAASFEQLCIIRPLLIIHEKGDFAEFRCRRAAEGVLACTGCGTRQRRCDGKVRI
jgi:fermentation-respiration switch protein FrsA (DUF1100 family)